MNDDDLSMLRVAEFEIMHMNMGAMSKLGLFEEMIENEFVEIERQIMNELMEDEAYRNMDVHQRPSPQNVLLDMLDSEEQDVEELYGISHAAATAIQSRLRGVRIRKNSIDELAADVMSESMLNEFLVELVSNSDEDCLM